MECPVVSPLCRITGDRLVLRDAHGTRTIQAPHDLLDAIAAGFDGLTDTATWIETHGHRWDPARLQGFLRMLLDREFLIPVSAMSDALWRHASNPRRYGAPPDRARLRDIEQRAAERESQRTAGPALQVVPVRDSFTALLEARRTRRGFGGGTIAAETMASLLWAGYGLSGTTENASPAPGRTVPSAGNLHPLRLHLVNLRPAGEIPVGIFCIEPAGVDAPVRLVRDPAVMPRAIARCFGSPLLLRGAQAAIVITGHFALGTAKYGPRAMSYVALEAGHAAQNILLMATSLGLAATETGEFEESAVEHALALAPGNTPLTIIVVGTPAQAAAWPPPAWELQWLDHTGPAPATVAVPRVFTARVRYGNDTEAAWGSDRHAGRAALKAYMEAEERLCTGHARKLILGNLREMRERSHPRLIAMLDDALPTVGARSPGHDTRFGWIEAICRFSGKAFLVPADCVFFRSSLPVEAVCNALPPATSSGVAAHRSLERATARALLELIERDAFMLSWLCRPDVRLVATHTLPPRARKLIDDLATRGVELIVRDLSTRFGIVILVFARSVTGHFTRVVTAAGLSAGQALVRALQEIEPMVRASLEGWRPSTARTADDLARHAAHYHARTTFRDADHLVEATSAPVDYSDIGKASPRSVPAIGDALRAVDLDPLVVDLGLGSGRPCVARTIVPGLIPLAFGAHLPSAALLAQHPVARHLAVRDLEWLARIPHPMC